MLMFSVGGSKLTVDIKGSSKRPGRNFMKIKSTQKELVVSKEEETFPFTLHCDCTALLARTLKLTKEQQLDDTYKTTIHFSYMCYKIYRVY